ncbi:MAG: hypothetical protein U5L09_11350 [Bacteroidales bacterium]|nr:hypothetical protein [Bacteroidales bacterium]
MAVIDLAGRRVSHKIGLGRTSESMVLAGDKLFAANWSMYAHPGKENNRVMVVDVLTDRVVDSVLVTKEPNSMVADKNGFVWILSSGGYENEETPALTKVDPRSRKIVKTFPFAAAQSNPVALTANAAADTLFWLNKGMYAMAISDDNLPEAPAIPQNDHIYYSLAITQQRILLSDAVDYQQRGVIYVYDKQYRLDTTFRAGIIPGFMLPVKP